ncbi:hypothetical protein CKAH01_08942 [Colletotrichum kahawae]|uniref:Uncharacterized protein n=1 Tax=Colletotrichum kahawae TaxID=34407 RepID=A0AAD9XZQ6_COLKA|nr:hypothetical protein CKAH01_08942 [Colletotrichum kahawae]
MDITISDELIHAALQPEANDQNAIGPLDSDQDCGDDFNEKWKARILRTVLVQNQEVIQRRIFRKEFELEKKSFIKKCAEISELANLADKRALEALTGNAVVDERAAVNADAIEAIRMVHTTLQEDASALRTRQDYDRQRIDDKIDRLAASNAYDLRALKKHFGDQLVRLQEVDNVLQKRLEGVNDRQDLMERVLAGLPQKHHMLVGGFAMIMFMYVLLHLGHE